MPDCTDEEDYSDDFVYFTTNSDGSVIISLYNIQATLTKFDENGQILSQFQLQVADDFIQLNPSPIFVDSNDEYIYISYT